MGSVRMNVFIVIAVPVLLLIIICGFVLYMHVRQPSPVAIGSALPKFYAVSTDEIQDYRNGRTRENTDAGRMSRQARWKQVRVVREYIRQMIWNTKLFQQVARFEKLKIEPAKSSMQYKTFETLALRLVEESAAVRWLLIKGQIRLTVHAFTGGRISQRALELLLQLVLEYKHLEDDASAWVSMASDEYHQMLIERLGLSNWGLIDGGSPATER